MRPDRPGPDTGRRPPSGETSRPGRPRSWRSSWPSSSPASALARDPGSTNQANAARGSLTPAFPPCVPLPYQPCGAPVAPFTDGRVCLPGHADYDGIAANGCEAASDYRAGTVLTSGQRILANIVPAGTVDAFSTYVKDDPFDFCTGEFRVTLTAPPGPAFRVDILHGPRLLASAVSRNGQPAVARAAEPSCFSSDSEWLTVRVSAVEGQSAADFQLTRNSGW